MTIPVIPHRTKEEALADLLESIALEEAALANLLQVEAEIVKVIGLSGADTKEIVKLQEILEKIIKTIAKVQMLLIFKLEKVEHLIRPPAPPKPILACIKTEKIYESCRKVKSKEIISDLSGIAEGEIGFVQCEDVEIVTGEAYPFRCIKIPGTNRARVSFFYRYSFKYQDEGGTKLFTSEPISYITSIAMSDRISDKRLMVNCEVFLDCQNCFVSSEQQVTCCIGLLLVFTLSAKVHLTVYEHGFCPEPPECDDKKEGCPEFKIDWKPYPEQ
jgi:hypothetical protein